MEDVTEELLLTSLGEFMHFRAASNKVFHFGLIHVQNLMLTANFSMTGLKVCASHLVRYLTNINSKLLSDGGPEDAEDSAMDNVGDGGRIAGGCGDRTQKYHTGLHRG